MSQKPEKIWEKPWTTEEIISKADNWSLAGDAALLHSFQKFAHNMFLKTDEISKNLDRLLSNTDEVQLKLSMCQNEFHSLKNSQFIESRVYEDDETLDSREKETVEEKISSEEEKEKMMFDAIAEGLKVMEEYYDKVEVDVSDSEEETEKSFILKPKDIYAHRQLPPVIGTDEWFKKWHLADEESSDSESDKVSEVYSESDSEECLPKHLLKGSETSSEIDTSSRISGSIPTANSGLSASVKKQAEISSSDESSEGRGSLPVKTPISSQSFAEQLSAKLGNVISQREDIAQIKEDVNTKPIQSTTNTNYVGGLFPDEPPPLDHPEESVPKISKGDPNLFDENDDDDLFWGQRPKQRFGQDELFGQNTMSIKKEEDSKNSTKTAQIARGLFDSDNSSDESDIFAGNAKALSKPPFLQTYKNSAPLFDDSPPDLDEKIEAERTVDKKPVGGVSIFGNTNIFANQTISDVLENKRAQRNSNESTVGPSKNESEITSKSKQLFNDKKPISLFDDDDDEVDFTVPKKKVGLFETGNKSTGTTSKKSDLFDDSISEEDTDKSVVSKKASLFNDSLSEEEIGTGKRQSIPTTEKSNVKSEAVTQKKTNLFGEEEEKNRPETSKKVSLFADPPSEKEDSSSKEIIPKASKKISLFDDDDDLFKDDIFSSLVTGHSGKGLFDDLDDADLFGVNKSMDKESEVKSNTGNKKVSLFRDNGDEEDIFESKTIKPDPAVEEPKKAVSLFSDTEDEMKSGKVEAELTSSKAREGDQTKTEEGIKSLSKRKVIGAGVVNEESEDKNKEKKSGVDDEEIPRRVDNEIAQKDENLSHTQSSDKTLSETNTAEIKVDTLFESQSSNAILSSTKEEPKEQKPVISLYSSAPPSDDEDDWDTKSDNMSDTDEYRPYSIDDNVSRSSLFDNEPPSLNPNESSGIVRDQNVTRVDSDDSSFYPHASSSKRFSSEIFAEQQSQDKLFVTGSTNQSNNVFPSSTESSSISEVTSKIISDIMDDTSFLITDNTLESTSAAHGLTEECSTTTDDVKSSDESIRTKTTKTAEMIKHESIENTVSKKSEKGDGDAKRDDSSNKPTKRGSPLKLKPNLNINVSALLPGSVPPKLKTPLVSDNGDKDKLDSLSQKKPIQTIDTRTEKPKDSISSSVPPPLPNSKEEYVEKPVSFDDDLEKVPVLHSVTKDRARIPVKRKPSTRKARQEAVRNSAIFVEDLDADKTSTNKDTSLMETGISNKNSETKKDNKGDASLFDDGFKTSTKTKTEIKSIKSTSLFEDSDEHEIFKDSEEAVSPSTLTIKSSTKPESKDDDIFSNTSKNIETTIASEGEKIPSEPSKDNVDPEKTKTSLFDDSVESEEEEEDFFKRTSKKPTKTKTSLFDSGDESDSNLFGSKTDKAGPERKADTGKHTKKKSLFDDSSSDDDLFSSGKSKNAVSGTTSSERATKTNSSLKKLNKGEASEDPLSKLSG